VVFGKCDNSLDTHLEKRKTLIFNIVGQMAKKSLNFIYAFNVTSKVGLTLAGPPCIGHILLSLSAVWCTLVTGSQI